MTRAFVLGGGVAGLCAAFELMDRGFSVELIEGRKRLGGRAFSLPERRLEGAPDNGPHVMLGCYARMRALLRRLGTESEFEVPRSLRLCYRRAGGAEARLSLARLPPPLALPPALLALRGLGLGEKLRCLRGLCATLRGAPADWTLEDWIVRRRQQGGPRRHLWDPMCRAIMNAEADQVAADLFLATMRRAFLRSAGDATIWIPRRPWSALIGDPAEIRLAAEGAVLTLGHRVTEIGIEDGRVRGIRLSDGAQRAVDNDDLVVSAVPWHDFERLLSGASGAAQIQGSPLVSIYFEFDVPLGLPDDPLIALVDGTPFHFMFRRPGCAAGDFALLTGGGRSLEGCSVADTVAAARRQMARYFPACALPDGGRVRVVREAQATVLATTGLTPLRPPPGRIAGFENLRVCGDWTRTDLPSTLEGAAESAHRALAD